MAQPSNGHIAEMRVDVLEVVLRVEQADEGEASMLSLGEGVQDIVRIPGRHDAEAKVHGGFLPRSRFKSLS